MTPADQLAAAKAAYDATVKKIADAVNAVKAAKGFASDPRFSVIACVPGESLAHFVIAVSHKMAQMAQSEMEAPRRAAMETRDEDGE